MSNPKVLGIKPEIWGPKFWYVWHVVASAYPNEPKQNDKETYKNFYKYISKVLPCSTCAKSTTDMIKKTTEEEWENILSNRNNLVDWVVDYHNDVNKKLGKKIYTEDELPNLIGKTLVNSNDNLFQCIIIILIIIILILLLR